MEAPCKFSAEGLGIREADFTASLASYSASGPMCDFDDQEHLKSFPVYELIVSGEQA